jgi:hypothetical protein
MSALRSNVVRDGTAVRLTLTRVENPQPNRVIPGSPRSGRLEGRKTAKGAR